jgi:hypothetical protein
MELNNPRKSSSKYEQYYCEDDEEFVFEKKETKQIMPSPNAEEN